MFRRQQIRVSGKKFPEEILSGIRLLAHFHGLLAA
jgi:hypothetical protein